MPLITNNTSLGNAFGGKIASLNYNYQPNSNPSSATITIVSENNEFIEPILLSDFKIPILDITMKITEIQYNEDSNNKVLQLELQDEISFILDKKLVLVTGIHTTNTGSVGSYTTTAGAGEKKYCSRRIKPPKNSFDRDSQPHPGIQIPRNPNGTPINCKKQDEKSESCISFVPCPGYGGANLVLNDQAITIGSLRVVAKGGGSTTKSCYINGEFIVNKEPIEPEVTKSWCYTLNELFLSLSKIGIKINKGNKIFPDLITFSESGTIRSVLTSCLSRLGLNFYIDPINNSINIIDNSFLSNLNKKIENIYNGSYRREGVISINRKKSCRDVVGRYLVVRSDFDIAPNNSNSGGSGGGGGGGTGGGGGGGGDEPPIFTTFKRLYYDKSEPSIIDKREIEFLKRIAYLYSANIDENLIASYIFALGKKYNPHEWSDKQDQAIYGGKRKDETTDLDQTKFVQVDPKSKTRIQVELEKNPPPDFDISNFLGFYPNTRTALITESNTRQIKKGILAANSIDKISSYIQDFIFLASGIYVGRAIESARRIEGMDWANTYGFTILGPFRANTKIKEISELAPVQRLFDRIGGNSDITIANLVKASSAGAGLGRNPYHFIAIRPYAMAVGPNFNESYDISSLIKKNLYTFNYSDGNPNQPQQFLLFTKNSSKIVNDIEKVCTSAWNYSFSNEPKAISLIYTYKSLAERRAEADGDTPESSDNGLDASDPCGCPKPPADEIEIGCGQKKEVSIYHKLSNLKFSSSIDLDYFEGPIGEANTLLNNISSFSIEQDGPLYDVSLEYFRLPLKTDIDISSGFSSISCSFSAEGSTTSISYQTKKYQNIDKSILSQLGSSNTVSMLKDSSKAFQKNLGNQNIKY
jgi:hypothetical protein